MALLLSLALGWALNAQPAPIRVVIGELDGINPLILGFEDKPNLHIMLQADFSPDARKLLVDWRDMKTRTRNVQVWDTASGKMLWQQTPKIATPHES